MFFFFFNQKLVRKKRKEKHRQYSYTKSFSPLIEQKIVINEYFEDFSENISWSMSLFHLTLFVEEFSSDQNKLLDSSVFALNRIGNINALALIKLRLGKLSIIRFASSFNVVAVVVEPG